MRSKIILLFAAGGAAWAANVPEANVDQIVQHSAQVIAEDWKQAPEYTYVEREVQSKKNSASTVKTYDVLMIDGSPYKRLIAVDDKPLSPAEEAQETAKLQNETQRRQQESDWQRERRQAKYQRERHQDNDMLKSMVDAFNFQLIGEEVVDGHTCWVLDAVPKSDYVPVNRETKVLAGMKGRLWIDKSSGQWARVKAEVIQPVALFGFLAKVRPGTRIVLEQQPVAQNVWLPKHFTTWVNASALGFISENSVSDETYSNYKPKAEALSQLDKHQ